MTRKRVGTIVVPPGVFIDVHEKMGLENVAIMTDIILMIWGK